MMTKHFLYPYCGRVQPSKYQLTKFVYEIKQTILKLFQVLSYACFTRMLEYHWSHCFFSFIIILISSVMRSMIHMWLFHSITHKAFLTSPHLNPHPRVTLKNIHLRLTHALISHMSPLQGTLPPARKSTIICVFRSQALCGSDWLTDRWQAVLLLHLLSVQITATCSVITVCKGCSSLCQRSNTLSLISVKRTSSDVCRSWRSKSFFATLSTPISDPG